MRGTFARRGAAIVTGWALALSGAHAALRVEGVPDSVAEVVRAYVTVAALPCDAPPWWVNRTFQRAEAEARQALEALGYYQATVAAELTFDEACWQAQLAVTRGEQARLDSVRIEVAAPLGDEPRMRELLDRPPLRKGVRFTHLHYEAFKSDLLDVAEDLGYFDARFGESRVLVDAAANTADVVLVLEGGERYRVGAVEIEQDQLRPGLFGRFLKVEAGQPFDARNLAATYRDLLGSQYYDRVLVAPDLDARADGQVPVRVTATSSQRRSILVGAGYATDSGPRARADLRYRRLNDRGHRANVSTVVSAVQGEFKADYRLPYGDPAHEWLFAESGFSYEDTDSYDSRRWSIGAGRTHRRGERWTETNYLDYRIDDFTVGGLDGRTALLLLGSSWTHKTFTEEPRPLTGYSLGFDVRGAARALLSDTDLVQTILRGRHIFPLGDRLRVLSRASVGWSWQQEFDDLPPSIRFFAGGDNSVRGYDFETIGPEVDGAVVGGRRLLTGSVELDWLVRPNWSVALFGDTGSAFDDAPDFKRGVGLGVRWYSPLGPLRFDVAHPLDDPNRSFRIHISLGPDL